MSETKPIVYVVQHNHFDPTWRRCWDRSFDYKGMRIRSYADLEEAVIDAWLENAKQGAMFSEGQAVVFRKYLERNPERLEEMRELVQNGLIEITAAGETVPDTNMPSGETLLRNLVMGQWYFEDTFGVVPKAGWLEDAFGQSSQIPQIFRGCECNHVFKMSYKKVPGAYWKGLDGTVIFKDGVKTCSASHYIKSAPCQVCNGVGCDKCGQLGLKTDMIEIADDIFEGAFSQDFPTDQVSLMTVGGEETLPRPDIAELVAQANDQYDVHFRFGGYDKISEFFADQIAKTDDPDIVTSDQVEANCACTGCYVTRIKIKQEFRRIENLVNAAERWATVAWLQGGNYPNHCLTEAWRSLVFVAFHDAITSSHIDAAYYEIMDMLAMSEHEAGHVFESALETIEHHISADQDKTYILLYNSDSWARRDIATVSFTDMVGCPALKDANGSEIPILDTRAEGDEVHVNFQAPSIPALGYTAVEVIPDASVLHAGDVSSGLGEIENEYYKLSVSERGIDSIVDKRVNKNILDTGKYFANELILEEDIGHPWGTMEPPSFEEGLSKYTTDVQIRRAAGSSVIRLTGQYKGSDPNVKALSWRQWVTLYDGVDRIDFRTVIDWDTAQRRIRVAFPTDIKQDEAVYSIPYGAIKRDSYEPDMTILPSTNGDWPAINWVDVHSSKLDRGVALINTGTPSHKVKDGVIFMSILRSPTDAWCLNEPDHYDCPDFDGARDAGTHEFHYSLISHEGDYRSAGIEKRAREVNNPIIVRLLERQGSGKLGLTHSFMSFDASDNVIVTALKKAEKSDAAIVRLAETGGQPGHASISLEGASGKQHLVNYLEHNPEPTLGPIPMGPFKVVTVKVGR